MRSTVLAFFLGIVTMQLAPQLPAVLWCSALPALIVVAWRVPVLRFPSVLLCGALWALWAAHALLSQQLPAALEGQDVVVTGHVATLPQLNESRLRFEFEVDTLAAANQGSDFSGRVVLSWFEQAPALKAGEQWQLTVRLKQPHGLMNPGGFDYEGWLFRHGLRATGYVRNSVANRRLADDRHIYPIQRLRQDLAERMQDVMGPSHFAGVLTALAIGEEHGIAAEQWRVFTLTGTTHLIAISGSHISLIAGLVFFIVRFLWSRTAWSVRRPAPQVAAWAAMLASVFYAALAGYTVPTQRALIMVVAVMFSLLRLRHTSPSHTLALALFAVLLYDPLAVMEAGFWLSFICVAIILFSMHGRWGKGGLWWQWGRIHGLIALGLVPVMLVLFHQLSLVSPLANFIAVPWVTFIVVPLTLLGAALSYLWSAAAALVFSLADGAMTLLWPVLLWMAQLEGAQWYQHIPPAWALVPGIIGVLLCLAPKGLPGRWLGWIYLLPLFLILPARPGAGELWFSLLDVGQGLAAVARTTDHTLVFDSGPRHSENFDTGAAVVIPYLRHQGINKIDTLVISHGDMDHRGGLLSILEQYPVDTKLSMAPQVLALGAGWQPCRQGQAWVWEGVAFTMLHPAREDSHLKENDTSCVLQIRAPGGTVLLPADIEKSGEQLLVERNADHLISDILVVPHHGSKTSSTEAFLNAVQPRYALFPVGYRNRYGFPKPQVYARYQARGVALYDNSRHGAIEFHIHRHGFSPPQTYRQSGRRYWHHQLETSDFAERAQSSGE